MTRIFTDGAEMLDTLFFSSTSGSATTLGGLNVYLFNGTQNGYKTISAVSELYFRQRLYIPSSASTVPGSKFPAFRSGSTTLAYLTAEGGLNRWILYVGSSYVGVATVSFVANTWYCVELYYKIDDAAGRFVLRIDGNTLIDFTGDTKPGADTTVDNIYWTGASGDTFYIDDLALNDTAGGSDDSWCGGGRVTKITPTGNGSTTEWTGSDADAVDNYLLVDEYPLDSDTTYVYEDASATGDLDQYEMSDDYSGTGKTIKRIWAECRARKTSVDAATLKIGFDTGASVNTDDVGTLWETYTARCVGAEYTTNPDDAAAWEEADIDALEFVAEVG